MAKLGVSLIVVVSTDPWLFFIGPGNKKKNFIISTAKELVGFAHGWDVHLDLSQEIVHTIQVVMVIHALINEKPDAAGHQVPGHPKVDVVKEIPTYCFDAKPFNCTPGWNLTMASESHVKIGAMIQECMLPDCIIPKVSVIEPITHMFPFHGQAAITHPDLDLDW